MGQVYLAEDRTNNNVQCVIKQLQNKYSDPDEHAEAIRLFQREATILRSLHHPGIVRFYDDYASEDGRYFLVMDYVPGKDLEQMVKSGGPFTSDAAVRISIQCCEVLEYLHSISPPVIYRDLKPSNLMLTPDGRVVFVDFGIARSFMPKVAATRVVTAGYSPPEQYFGKPETRSDLYSLGATISHLVTGVRPKPLALCTPGLLNSKVIPSLDALVRNLTAHSPDDRPATAQAVRWELYKIYKEMHPEFQLPEDAGIPESYIKKAAAAAREAAHSEPDIRSLARFRASPYDSRQRGNSADAASQRPGFREEPTVGFWGRFKQWLQIFMS
jgi:serine/threonine protein kinase